MTWNIYKKGKKRYIENVVEFVSSSIQNQKDDMKRNSSQAQLDPFDESFFVEKKVVDREKNRQEEEAWSLVSQGVTKIRKQPEPKPDPSTLSPSAREYNKTGQSQVYTFGDKGSSWRMMKLRNLREAARSTGRDVEDLAFERYGSMEKFDEAREEEEALKAGRKGQPDGHLYQERMQAQARDRKHDHERDEQIIEAIKQDAASKVLSIGELNALKARTLKAQLLQTADAQHLQREYEAALEHYEESLISMPIEAKNKVDADMTIEEMVRQEKQESRMQSQSRRDADRIARDVRYKDDLDYQDENAERLAARVKTKEINVKNASLQKISQMNKVLDECPLCHHEDGTEPPLAPVITLATRVYLSLPSSPLTKNHCLIVPIQHRGNTLECDDDEHQEIRNFMKSITRMFDGLGYSAMFFEDNSRPYKHNHIAIECIPIPKAQANIIPRVWHESILAVDEEWSQHRPLIDTSKNQFQRRLSAKMPYFHVWFDLNGGLGHIIEDDAKWPHHFGREVAGSILRVDWRSKGAWTGDKDTKVEKEFTKFWARWDWTKALMN